MGRAAVCDCGIPGLFPYLFQVKGILVFKSFCGKVVKSV